MSGAPFIYEEPIFCKIVSKSITSRIVFENEQTLVIVSTDDDVSGHLLIIPKVHVKDLNNVDIKILFELQKTLMLLNNHLINTCKYDGVNILLASGKAAGQSVPHIHFHVIPRKNRDGLNAWPFFSTKKESTSDELFKHLRVK